MSSSLIVTPLGQNILERLTSFSCGDGDLDDFVRQDAWRLQTEHVAVTYLARDERSGEVVGYCTLLNDAVRLLTKERKKLGLASDDHPIVPAVKVARLGVSIARQGSGVGVLLVQAAYFAARRADSISGCRLLTVDAYPTALPFYERLGFEPNKAADYRDRENPSLRLDVFSKSLPAWI